MGMGAFTFGLAFSLSTYERWLVRRRPHELAWAISLAMFAVAALGLGFGAAFGWSSVTFRIFYLFGAVLNVPFLGLGEIFLLFGERVGKRSAYIVAAFSLLSVGVLVSSPLLHPLPLHALAQGSRVFGPLPRILAAVGSGGGALVVFAGTVWSLFRTRLARYRIANTLIATGTAISGASGLLNSVADQMTGFAVALTVGIAIIFAGFLVANSNAATIRSQVAQRR